MCRRRQGWSGWSRLAEGAANRRRPVGVLAGVGSRASGRVGDGGARGQAWRWPHLSPFFSFPDAFPFWKSDESCWAYLQQARGLASTGQPRWRLRHDRTTLGMAPSGIDGDAIGGRRGGVAARTPAAIPAAGGLEAVRVDLRASMDAVDLAARPEVGGGWGTRGRRGRVMRR